MSSTPTQLLTIAVLILILGPLSVQSELANPLVFQFPGYYVIAYSALTGYVVQGTYNQTLPIEGNVFMGFNALYLVERETITQGSNYHCRAPNDGLGNPFAPEDPLGENGYWGPILRVLPLDRFNYALSTIVENPNSSVVITHYIFDGYDPVSGSALQINVSVTTGGNYSVPYSLDTSNTGGEIMYFNYLPNSVKLSYGFQQYSWAQTSGSFLTLAINFSIGAVAGTNFSIVSASGGQVARIELQPTDGSPLMLDLDQWYGIDQVPYLLPFTSYYSTSFPFNYVMTLAYSFDFCQNSSYSALIWDPRLSGGLETIFSPPISPPSSPNSPSHKSQATLIIGVCVAVGAVSLLILGVVVVYFTIPAARQWINPFHQRKAASRAVFAGTRLTKR